MFVLLCLLPPFCDDKSYLHTPTHQNIFMILKLILRIACCLFCSFSVMTCENNLINVC